MLIAAGAELFSEQHRQRGVHALPHFRFVTDHRDGAVGADPQEGVGLDQFRRPGGVRDSIRFTAAGQITSDDQAAGGGRARLQEATTGDS
jgi:hypothetical protein